MININAKATPSTINAISKLSFMLYLNSVISSTDIIKIKIPPQVIVSNGSRSCTVNLFY